MATDYFISKKNTVINPEAEELFYKLRRLLPYEDCPSCSGWKDRCAPLFESLGFKEACSFSGCAELKGEYGFTLPEGECDMEAFGKKLGEMYAQTHPAYGGWLLEVADKMLEQGRKLLFEAHRNWWKNLMEGFLAEADDREIQIAKAIWEVSFPDMEQLEDVMEWSYWRDEVLSVVKAWVLGSDQRDKRVVNILEKEGFDMDWKPEGHNLKRYIYVQFCKEGIIPSVYSPYTVDTVYN